MVPEKVAAFGRSGAIFLEAWSDTLSDIGQQTSDLRSLMFRARALTAGELLSYSEQTTARGTRMMSRAIGVGGRALAPIHEKATTNARRLAKPDVSAPLFSFA
jgi:hypothetical protein